MAEEKRLHKRKLINARVCLIHPDIGSLNTYTHDISNGGVFVLVREVPKLPLGSIVQMKMLDAAKTDIIFDTELMRTDSRGLGLKFLGYQVDGQRHDMEALKELWQKQDNKKA